LESCSCRSSKVRLCLGQGKETHLHPLPLHCTQASACRTSNLRANQGHNGRHTALLYTVKRNSSPFSTPSHYQAGICTIRTDATTVTQRELSHNHCRCMKQSQRHFCL
jgi:hypothetical protein